MKRLVLALDKTLAVIGIALEGLLAFGVIVSVILRYVFSISFAWSEELLTMVFVATTFLGATLGVRLGEHIAITHFLDAFPKQIRKVFIIAIQIVVIIVSVFVIIYGIRMIQKVGNVPSPATGIKRSFYYLLIPISFTGTIFYSIVHIIGQFITIPVPKKGYEDDDSVELKGGE